jgi:hypothetical protein
MSGISQDYSKATTHAEKAEAALEVAIIHPSDETGTPVILIAICHAVMDVAQELNALRYDLQNWRAER